MPDLHVENQGNIYLLYPLSPEGQEWMDQNLPDDVQTFGSAVVVEHRYIAEIVIGAQDDGLKVI